MQILFKEIMADRGLSFVGGVCLFLLLHTVLIFGYLLFKRFKNKKFFKVLNDEIKILIASGINGMLMSGSIFLLMVVKLYYFKSLDGILSVIQVLGGIIFFNIIFKLFNLAYSVEGKLENFIKNIFLKAFDNFVMVMVLTVTSAILASQIPVVEISKFFGVTVRRATLINLPFIIMAAYLLVCDIGIILQPLMKKLDIKIRLWVNEFYEVLVIILVSLLVVYKNTLSQNVFLLFVVGIISTYLVSKLSSYIKLNHTLKLKHSKSELKILYPISNIFLSSFIDLFVICVVISTGLNLGGFYGMSIICLGMVSGMLFRSVVGDECLGCDVYKYLAKAVNNLVLFYIFFETLEYILKRQVSINLFSNNVMVGLFLSVVLVIFNTLKVINLVKYINMGVGKRYMLFRTALYIGIFVTCIYMSLPFMNYELLGAFILGLVIITCVVSLIAQNIVDVLDNPNSQDRGKMSLTVRNIIVPIVNNITTLIIIITILLLPVIKIGG